MLSPDVRIDGFDTADWLALTALRGAEHGDTDPAVSGLFVLREGPAVVKVVSTARGRLPLPEGSASIGDLASTHGASWVLSGDATAFREMVDQVEDRWVREDDFLDQILKAAHVIRELSREGRVTLHPRDARTWRIPRRSSIDRALDIVCPAGKVILVGAFAGGRLSTSLALRRGRRGFDRVMGPSDIRGELGLVSGDWTRDCHGVVRAVERASGPVALGAFATAGTWRGLISGSAPGRWAAALAARDIVIHPMSAAVAVPLGIDLGRAALSAGLELAQRFGVAGRSGGRAALSALERLRDSGAGHDAERVLGFDPLRMLSHALSLFAGDA